VRASNDTGVDKNGEKNRFSMKIINGSETIEDKHIITMED